MRGVRAAEVAAARRPGDEVLGLGVEALILDGLVVGLDSWVFELARLRGFISVKLEDAKDEVFSFGGDLKGRGIFAERGAVGDPGFALGGWGVEEGEELVYEGLNARFGGGVLRVEEAEERDFGHRCRDFGKGLA